MPEPRPPGDWSSIIEAISERPLGLVQVYLTAIFVVVLPFWAMLTLWISTQGGGSVAYDAQGQAHIVQHTPWFESGVKAAVLLAGLLVVGRSMLWGWRKLERRWRTQGTTSAVTIDFTHADWRVIKLSKRQRPGNKHEEVP